VPGLLKTLRAGKIDGSTYHGKCACLVGTVANLRGCDIDEIKGLEPDSSRPAERWFLAILPGITPENHPIAKITEDWIVEWLKERGIDARAKVVVSTREYWRQEGDSERWTTLKAARTAHGANAKLIHVTVKRLAFPQASP
jgi:hypothetical protein